MMENDDSLTLATLCDMVLGEDAKDRSNDALVRGVGRLLRHVGTMDNRFIPIAFRIHENTYRKLLSLAARAEDPISEMFEYAIEMAMPTFEKHAEIGDGLSAITG